MLVKLFGYRNKLSLLLLSLAYAYVFMYSYKHYTIEHFAYLTGGYKEPSSLQLFVYYCCATIPFLFYKGFIRIASIFSLFTYILSYVPFLVGVCVDMNFQDCCVYSIVTAVLMIIAFCFDTYCFRLSGYYKSPKLIDYLKFERLTIILVVFIAIRFIGQLTFVNILSQSDEMYELRESRGFDTVSTYLMLWNTYALLPVCLIYNLCINNKKKILMFLGFYVIAFMLDMQKMTLIMPFAIVSLFYIVKNSRQVWAYFHALLIIALLIICLILLHLGADSSSIFYGVAAIIIMRTIHVGAWLTTIYIDFFDKNQYTLFGHVGIVNKIFHTYPYGDTPLGRVVANGDMNANANFILTDGFSSCGLLGIVIMFLVFILFKSIMNNIGRIYDYRYCSLMLIPAISALMNASLFSSLFSFGFIVLFFIFKYVDFSLLKNGKNIKCK